MALDPFGDAASRGYLRNSAGTNDMEQVKRLEHAAFRANVAHALYELSQAKSIGQAEILQTHKTLFSSVYPWAGESRSRHAPNSAISKGGRSDLFADPREVGAAMDYALKQGNDKNFMANKPGEVMGSLAYAHPFLDGNGRTIMVVHTELANRAGITIAWEKTDKADYLQALTKELDQPGKGHLDNYLKPFVQNTIDKQEQVQTVNSLPGFGPAEAKAVEMAEGNPEAFTKPSADDTSKATETPKVERPKAETRKGQRLR
jgi:cell filamentation protein